MKRIGIFGGTFNPPHVGHLRAAQFAQQALKLDKVLLIPGFRMPHKDSTSDDPTPCQRLQMLRLAVASREGLVVSDLEIAREGISYTWETVAQLREQYPDAELYLLLGSDKFSSIAQWKNCDRIFAETVLVALCRGEKDELARMESVQQTLHEMGAQTVVLENTVTAIASSDVRRLLAFGCVPEQLPEPVGRYIQANGLYGINKDCRQLPLDVLEQVVVSLLKPSRVAHVLGCRQTAVALAKRYGADETDAARAALLHDITKALDGPLQLTLCHAYGTMLDAFSADNPKTLHALTGSLVADRIFGENAAVVDAIRWHTTGKQNMNLLEKIIYVADYMEPNRDFPGVETLRQLAYEDIDKALKLGLQMTLDMLRRQMRQISPQSQEALAYLESCGV